jgi:hypothetical protein
VLGAVATSSIFPIGRARVAEPDPGFGIDLTVLAIGFGITVVVGIAVALTADVRRDRPSAHRRLGRLEQAVAAAPPTIGVGIRSLLRSPDGRWGGRAQALLGAVLGLSIVAATTVFGLSLDRFVDSPERDGWRWDARAALGMDLDDSQALVQARKIAQLEGVRAATYARVRQLALADGSPLEAIGTHQLTGTTTLELLAGRGRCRGVRWRWAPPQPPRPAWASATRSASAFRTPGLADSRSSASHGSP